MSRESFLKRVADAARAGQAYRVATRATPADVGYVGAEPDLCAALAREVIAVGGAARVVDGWSEAARALHDLLRKFEPRSAVCWDHPTLARLELAQILRTHGIVAFDYDRLAKLDPVARRAALLEADIGVTSCDWAIAETGSLALRSRAGRERAASLLPPIHVAVVAQSQIVPDLLDLFRLLHAAGLENLPSNLALVTGPSKTGDIELQLTTGVHGPGKWHVLIIRDDAGPRP